MGTMRNGECKVGMRVAYNAEAKRTRGVAIGIKGESRHHIAGDVVEMTKNEYDEDLARVEWDDGVVGYVCVCWVRQRGGYRHGKRNVTRVDNCP